MATRYQFIHFPAGPVKYGTKSMAMSSTSYGYNLDVGGAGITSFTSSIWYKRDTSVSDGGAETYLTFTANDGDDTRSGVIYLNNLGILKVRVAPNGVNLDIITASNIEDDTWHHILLTSSGSDCQLYLDSVLVGSYGSTLNLDLGSIGYLADSLRGSVAQFDIFSAHFDQSAVDEIYQRGNVLDPSTHSNSADLEFSLSMGDNVGDSTTTLIDESPNAYPVTFGSAVTINIDQP